MYTVGNPRFSAFFVYGALLEHNVIIDKVVTYEVQESADY